MSDKPEQETHRRSLPRRLLNRIEVDQAVFAAVVARAWQFLSGPVTWILIALYFSEDTQGYYVTFGSLLALQLFVELGMNTATIHIASHEWTHLHLTKDGRIGGDANAKSRLTSLVRLVLRWYSIAIFAFMAAVGGGGMIFFSLSDSGEVAWRAPWLALVFSTGCLLWTLPMASILEGCNQVVEVNRYRLVQAMLGTLAVWASIAGGLGLWTLVISSVVRVLVEGHLIGIRYRNFFLTFLKPPEGELIRWKSEVWPLQWKLGLQAVFRFFAFYMFNPIIFHYHSKGEAGRLGLVWNALTAVQAAAYSWVQTRTPIFGMLVAKKDYRELDRIFFRLTVISTIILLVALCALCGVIFGLQFSESWLAVRLRDKLLDPLPTAVFSIGVLLFHLPQCFSIYLLAHKKNPMYLLSVACNTLIGILVVVLGIRYGSIGTAIAFSAVISIIATPGWTLIWWNCRHRWHSEPA